MRFFVITLFLALFIPASFAATKPTIQAKHTTEKIKLDGLLDESVWASAMKAGGDMQQGNYQEPPPAGPPGGEYGGGGDSAEDDDLPF